MKHRLHILFCACSLLNVASVAAQTARQPPTVLSSAQSSGLNTATTIADSPIFVRPDAAREPVRVAKVGSRLNLMEQDGEWCLVEFQDPQYGLRRGYVQTQFLKIEAAQLRPLDLSVPTNDGAVTARPQPAPRTTPAPAQAAATLTRPRSRGMVSLGWGAALGGGFLALMTSGAYHAYCGDSYDSIGLHVPYDSGSCSTRSVPMMTAGLATAGGGIALIVIGSQRVSIAPSRTGMGATAVVKW